MITSRHRFARQVTGRASGRHGPPLPSQWRAAPLVALLLVASCTASQALNATGESLAAVGETFAATGALMDQALDRKAVTVEQYRAWATFAKRFKLVYPLACDTWNAGMAVNDGQAAQHAGAIVAALSADLVGFTALAGGAR